MAVESVTRFDLDAFKRAYEKWEIEALLGLYANEVELVQLDRDNPPELPPSAQRQGSAQGDVRALRRRRCPGTVENTVAGQDRAATTVTCEFPGGRKVVANGILELRDGRIVRERAVVADDQKR